LYIESVLNLRVPLICRKANAGNG